MPNFTDGFNFLSKLTPLRVLNAAQVAGSYILSRITRKAKHSGYPISISLEPTTSCNLRCPECPSGLRSFTRPTGMLQEGLFKQTIDQLHRRLLYLIFYFQGEPYLHKNFLELVKYASDRGIYTATSTNAHFLDDDMARKTVASGLDRLIVSIDGTTQETYTAYRIGGKLDKVLDGVRHVVKWKQKLKTKTPHIMFQFLVVRPNEHQLEDVKKLAKELGVDEVVFKTAQIYDYEQGSPLIPTIDYYSRYKNNGNGSYSIKNKLLNHCWRMWHSCVITWDGLVVPCCFDKDAEYRQGDLKLSSFKEVWRGAKYNQFRQALLRSRAEIEMCKNCTEGTKVWA
ncbi:SPASM domain-containing protein [Pontibacter silvestris]|uniref:SPASM domain-containing protein n=1 Tax=Pontibacter silvestris TaxID=2305183 RepID=A0ABW4X2H9_9BACT|nr:SPASM domain-containing protein [Pontibacter silvestris]MCC9135703.1 SPASM domain-containing protein [Pontibacter silvestris]